MGLDMFIYGVNTEYKSKYSDDVEKTQIITVRTEEIYWRKSNQIHNWFVENIQGGSDDCNYYTVTIEELEQLKDACEHVLEHREEAEEILPVRMGPFFGLYSYDEMYFNDLKRTVDEIDRVIGEYENSGYDWLEYGSSW